MAILANIGRLNMREILANCFCAVVTADTISGDIHMIKIGRQPANGRMTVIAIVAARDMRGVFSGCSKTVMTGAAAAQDLRVIDHVHGCPHVTVVAVLADICRLHVGQIFTRGIHTVVAVHATARNIQVVECRGSPGNCRVTIVAGLASREMRRMLAGCNNSIVA